MQKISQLAEDWEFASTRWYDKFIQILWYFVHVWFSKFTITTGK